MKKLLLSFALALSLPALAGAAEVEAGSGAYVNIDGQPLLADKSPDAATVDKLKAHQKYTVVTISGKWAQINSGKATGWVYIGNLSPKDTPRVNNSAFETKADGTQLTAA